MVQEDIATLFLHSKQMPEDKFFNLVYTVVDFLQLGCDLMFLYIYSYLFVQLATSCFSLYTVYTLFLSLYTISPVLYCFIMTLMYILYVAVPGSVHVCLRNFKNLLSPWKKKLYTVYIFQ